MVPVLSIERYGTGGSGTFGKAELHRFAQADAPVWTGYTLEEQWRGNQRSVSCIAAGRYKASLYTRPSNGQVCYLLHDVSERDAILIHTGNTTEATEGCILVGVAVGSLTVDDENVPGPDQTVKGAVLRSREAFEGFMRACAGADEILVAIDWAPGTNPEGP